MYNKKEGLFRDLPFWHMQTCILSLHHIFRDFLQIVDEHPFVLIELAAFFRDDTRIDIKRLLERNGHEVFSGQHGLTGQKRRADALFHEILDGMEIRRQVDEIWFAFIRHK